MQISILIGFFYGLSDTQDGLRCWRNRIYILWLTPSPCDKDSGKRGPWALLFSCFCCCKSSTQMPSNRVAKYITNIIKRKTGNILQSKNEGKDQESIQSNTTSDPGYQLESDNLTIRHHKREPRGQPFPAGDHKASINRRTRKHNKSKKEIT